MARPTSDKEKKLHEAAKKTFEKRFKMLCKEKGLAAAQVANQLGISRPQVTNYLNGMSMPPSYRLAQIARYFGVPIEYLVIEDYDIAATGKSEQVARLASLASKLDAQALEAVLKLVEILAEKRKRRP